MGPAMRGSVKHLNPEGLHKNPAYSQAVVTPGNVRTVYVGGQNAIDASGKVVGKDDISMGLGLGGSLSFPIQIISTTKFSSH